MRRWRGRDRLLERSSILVSSLTRLQPSETWGIGGVDRARASGKRIIVRALGRSASVTGLGGT